MKLAERLALISAGYKKKEIDALEDIEREETEKINNAPAEETPAEPTPDYKTMYEQAVAENENLKKSVSDKENQIKEIQASNRNDTHESTEAPNFLDTLFS